MKKDPEKILQFQKERDWKQYHLPKNLAISLAIEASKFYKFSNGQKTTNSPGKKRKGIRGNIGSCNSAIVFQLQKYKSAC